ncbi:MAG: hypothetical protein E7459_02850 [Ruminococcaceae bacterium]|nr:hypothetical protein [Oscillospiraceae bacterium]
MDNIWVQLILTLVSGLVATIVTIVVSEKRRKKQAKYDYKLSVFKEVMAYRTDLTGGTNTGRCLAAVNQVSVAYNDCSEVMTALKEFCEATWYKVNTQQANGMIVNKLLVLMKSMAQELELDYSFANDEFFMKPITISRSSEKSRID